MVTFINNNINKDDVVNIKSTHISTFLQRNNANELKKVYDFYTSNQSLLVITGFSGTGKRLLVEHSLGFLESNVIKLEYDCKNATVCDDILLYFIETMQKSPEIKRIFAPKIENFTKTLNRYISVSSAPVLIFINSFDNILEKNAKLILDFLFSITESEKVKLIITAKKFDSGVIPQQINFTKILSKPFNKDIFKEYLLSKNINADEDKVQELYKLTRGYYYYTKLATSLINTLGISPRDFIDKCNNSGKVFDKYLCDLAMTSLSIPVRNFFWFLLLLRHGISYDALSVLDLYDENSIKFLLSNGYLYETNNTLFVSNYFHSDVEILIPAKIKQKLHKYLIDIYRSQLQEKPEKRVIKLSRQSLNAEIVYHASKAESNDEQVNELKVTEPKVEPLNITTDVELSPQKSVNKSEEDLLADAEKYSKAFKFTEAIDCLNQVLAIIEDARKKIEIYLKLAKIYAKISEWSKSLHYYSLVHDFYLKNNEPMNVNYTKFEIADVYYNTFNGTEARNILKEVIYSQDSTNGLMIDACLKLGNIEDYDANYEEAFRYYKQGVDSIDDFTNQETANELYFRYAVALDEKNNNEEAISYYEKYLNSDAQEFKSATFCNLGIMHEEIEDFEKAEEYYIQAYEFDTKKNNYDGIYHSSLHLARMLFNRRPKDVLQYINTAKNSAETLNDSFYIAESHLLAGDYYYRNGNNEKALEEYLTVYMNVKNDFSKENLKSITDRIRDMELRLGAEKYTEIMKKHG